MMLKYKIKMAVKKFIPKPFLNFIRNFILGKPFNLIPKNVFKAIFASNINKKYLIILDKILKNSQGPKNTLNYMFKGISDDFWYWIYTKGYSQRPLLSLIMPSMPEEHLQLQFTGTSGDKTLEEAFSFYQFIKHAIKQKGVIICRESKVLDFGCGWGRITRFFLKDIPASNLDGIDCDEEIIKVCQTSNLNCNFHITSIYPPTEFNDNSFDMIYSYSVFSHLSEDAHKQWLTEFKRILKPGGVLIVTTRDRDFIISCARIRGMTETKIPFFAKGTAGSFLNTSESLMEYDSGKYVHEPVGGGGIRESSFYGETCIPKKYVMTEWLKYFDQLDFIKHKKHRRFSQNAIICKK